MSMHTVIKLYKSRASHGLYMADKFDTVSCTTLLLRAEHTTNSIGAMSKEYGECEIRSKSNKINVHINTQNSKT